MKQHLLKEIENNNTTNLGRSLSTEQHAGVLQLTDFLLSPKNFNERVYCIVNDITAQPLDMFGNPARFINISKGYSYKLDTAINQLKRDIADIKRRRAQLTKTMCNHLKQMSPEVADYQRRQKKIQKFKQLNRKRNGHLYQPSMTQGFDYVECPATQERMSMIKSLYIKRVLELTVDEYDALYPGARKSCAARSVNIKQGLHAIDAESGLTKYELGQEKARKKLADVDENGISGYQHKGQKTRASHMANVDENGRNGYQQLAHYRKTTLTEDGLTIEAAAHIKQVKACIANNGTLFPNYGSVQSQRLREITKIFDKHSLKYYYQDTEYVIFDSMNNKHYFYDLTCPALNLVIEFQGSGWHTNPFTTTLAEWAAASNPTQSKTAQEQHDYDYAKARAIYNERGYVVFFVYHDTVDNDLEVLKEFINDCIQQRV